MRPAIWQLAVFEFFETTLKKDAGEKHSRQK